MMIQNVMSFPIIDIFIYLGPYEIRFILFQIQFFSILIFLDSELFF